MCGSNYWFFLLLITGLTLANQPSSQMLLMSQLWKATWCLLILQEGYSCNSTSDSWTMHGIWLPGQVDGITIYCNETWPFNKEDFISIEPDLDRFWPNIKATEATRYDFWEHEWTKHGTCVANAVVSEPLNTQLKYFQQGLRWIKQYELTSTLNKTGILPSNEVEYDVRDFFKAILSTFKVKPLIKCSSYERWQFVSDVILCFNSTLQLSNCEVEESLREGYNQTYIEETPVFASCDFGKGVMYLSNKNENLLSFFNSLEINESSTIEP